MKPRYWSDVAQREFAALFEDRDYGRAFMDQVADAIIRGWPPNRDKPLWALVLLVNALAATRPAMRGRGGGAPGLEILTLPSDAVLKRLAEHPGGEGEPVSVEKDGVKVRLTAYEASIVIGRTRVALLRKIAEFLMAADGYRHARDVMEILDSVARPGVGEGEFREAVRTLSRRLYEYRKAHITEGHAASGFEYVKRTFTAPGKREPTDDDILELWRSPENASFVTYRMAFGAALDFLKRRRELSERASVAGSTSVDEPAIAATVASPADGEEDGPAGAASALGFAPLAEGSDATPFRALQASSLKTYTRAELDFFELVASVWPEGEGHTLSVLRLLAFHPIQSAISNSLRTGRAKVPLAERVTCVEAASYTEIDQRLEALAAKTAGWLAAGYALKVGEEAQGRAAEIRDRGRAVLSRTRAQSFDRPREELAALFAEVGEDLVHLARMLASLREAIRALPARAGRSLEETFEADRALFAAEFARRYLGPGPAPAPASEPASVIERSPT